MVMELIGAAGDIGAEPLIASVGTAVAGRRYTQRELLGLFGIADPKVRALFGNSGIRHRSLTLPPPGTGGVTPHESQGELLDKHRRVAVEMGVRAVRTSVARAGLVEGDVGFLCCVTTTGFLTPGLSALLLREMGLPPSTQRLDVVGMGCNAALNGLNAVRGWCATNQGRAAVLLCAEVCSAAYAVDPSMRTAVVNSLFGDGAAALTVTAPAAGEQKDPGVSGTAEQALRPRLLASASHVITAAADAMRFDWDDRQGRFSFFLDRQIPYVIGAHVEQVVDGLLAGAGLRRSTVAHWLVHAGGRKVIDAVRVNLRLARWDLRHTVAVLREYGNLSSASVLFSFERLVEEGAARRGDYGVLMAMGPGSTIETALVQWR